MPPRADLCPRQKPRARGSWPHGEIPEASGIDRRCRPTPLRNLAYKHLEKVYTPTLVLYSEGDHTVYTDDYKIVVNRIRSDWIQQHILKHSDHLIFQDAERDIAFQVVGVGYHAAIAGMGAVALM